MKLSILTSHYKLTPLQKSDYHSLPDIYLVGDLIGTLSDNGDIDHLSLPATKKLLSSISHTISAK